MVDSLTNPPTLAPASCHTDRHAVIKEELECLKKWEGKLMFDCSPVAKSKTGPTPVSTISWKVQDILNFTKLSFRGTKVYFKATKYSPTSKFDGPEFKLLLLDLKDASRMEAYEIHSQGWKTKG